MASRSEHGPLNGLVVLAIITVVLVGLLGVVRRIVPEGPPKGAPGTTSWCEPDGDKGCFPALCQEAPTTIVVFHAEWCGVCKAYARDTLSNPDFIEGTRPYAKIRVDTDRNPGIADRFGIEGVPTTLILHKGCVEHGRLIGHFYPDAVLKNIEDLSRAWQQ